MSCIATNTEGSAEAKYIIDVACKIIILLYNCHSIKIIAKRFAHKASDHVLILVTITDGPNILEGPKTVRAREGENVSFYCKVTVCKNFILKGWSFIPPSIFGNYSLLTFYAGARQP